MDETTTDLPRGTPSACDLECDEASTGTRKVELKPEPKPIAERQNDNVVRYQPPSKLMLRLNTAANPTTINITPSPPSLANDEPRTYLL